jgi:hypothetical protein
MCILGENGFSRCDLAGLLAVERNIIEIWDQA